MLLTIPQVLSGEELDVVRQLLATAPFADGKRSAGKEANRVKINEELAPDTSDVTTPLNNLVMGNLVQHPVYRAAALPLHIAAPYYARYSPGMCYGRHVDDPLMGSGNHYRSDISITIFLSAPDDYEGGELVIHTAFGEQRAKLAAGDALMYPSSSLHEVTEVTCGTRLVAVTWVQSVIRDAAQRELLYELGQAREMLLKNKPDAPETAQVSNSYVNLVRMWSEI
jgi:PKHD-type hydroxylase